MTAIFGPPEGGRLRPRADGAPPTAGSCTCSPTARPASRPSSTTTPFSSRVSSRSMRRASTRAISRQALELARRAIELFWDDDEGGFFFAADAGGGAAAQGDLRRRRAVGQFRHADEPPPPGPADRPRRISRRRRPGWRRLSPPTSPATRACTRNSSAGWISPSGRHGRSSSSGNGRAPDTRRAFSKALRGAYLPNTVMLFKPTDKPETAACARASRPFYQRHGRRRRPGRRLRLFGGACLRPVTSAAGLRELLN